MKRSWRDKLDSVGVELLADYRKLDAISTWDEFDQWVEAVGIPREHEGLPNLFPNRVLLTMFMMELGKMLPEIWQKLEEMEIDFHKHMEISAFRWRVRRLIGILRRMEFGNAPLDGENRRALAARFFGLCEQMCRGQLVPPKGTQNLERADLVNFIREHEQQRLTWEELLEALRDAESAAAARAASGRARASAIRATQIPRGCRRPG